MIAEAVKTLTERGQLIARAVKNHLEIRTGQAKLRALAAV